MNRTKSLIILASGIFLVGGTIDVAAQDGPTYDGLLQVNEAKTQEEKNSVWRSFGNRMAVPTGIHAQKLLDRFGFDFGHDVPAGDYYSAKAPKAPIVVQETPGIFVEYESVWVRPSLTNHNAFNAESIAAGGTVGLFPTHYTYDNEQSGRFIIGAYKPTASMGFRARHWHFESTSDTVTGDDNRNITVDAIAVIIGGAGINDIDTISVTHELETDVSDLEAMKKLGDSTTASVGVRIVDFQQTASVFTDEGNTTQHLDFRGVGPSASIETKVPIGQSNFYFFGSARASALFGERDLQGGGIDGVVNGGSGANDEVSKTVFNTDLKGGIEWRPQDGVFYTRAGVEYQYWAGVGNLTEISGTGIWNDTLTPGSIVTADSYGGDISFFGFVWSAGFIY